MTTKIQIKKAGPVAGNAPRDMIIEITGEPPELEAIKEKEWREKYDAFYNEQADTLGKALIESLPGGTIDRLIVFFLTQKASYFRVPYVEPHEVTRISDLIESAQPFLGIAEYADDRSLDSNSPITFSKDVSTTYGDARKLRDAVNKFF